MSGRADDLRLVVSAEINRRIRLGVDNAARQTSDSIGAIPPGRYLVEGVGLGVNTMAVKAVPFVAGASETIAIPAAPAAGVSDIADGLLITADMPSFFLHVRTGVNDRLVAIMSAGTATVEMNKVGS